MLYALTRTEAPTRWYEIVPGILSPDDQQEFIRVLGTRNVDYILLSNRPTFDYGVPYFGEDYCRLVYSWINRHYYVVGEFGDFRRLPSAPFSMLLYARRARPGTARIPEPY